MSLRDFKHAFLDVKFISHFLGSTRSSYKSKSVSRDSRNESRTPLSSMSYRSYEEDPLKRLQSMITVSNNKLDHIFSEIDTNASGHVSVFEFRKALRKLNLGLTAREIDNIITRTDANNNGIINWKDFNAQFTKKGVEKHIKGVASEKIAKWTENMFMYMLSPRDAFNQFDKERNGNLNFEDFVSLMNKLCELSKESLPSYTVLRDLFEIIDMRKDGVLDLKEWLSTFKSQELQKTTLQSTQVYDDFNYKVHNIYDDVCLLISKHRKGLLLTFEAMSGTGKVTINEAKTVLSNILKGIKLTEQLWTQVLRVAIKDSRIDYKFLLDVYKDRALTKQMHPKMNLSPNLGSN